MSRVPYDTRYDDWTPSADNINALPDPLKMYIHDLIANCDPAGMVAENSSLREQRDALAVSEQDYRARYTRSMVSLDALITHGHHCFFCGLVIVGGKPAVAAHVDVCEQHPLAAARKEIAELRKPVDMLLFCPSCRYQHVDEADDEAIVLEKNARGEKSWQNPPHRSHLCAECGTIWRPADVPTNGVRALQTSGKADTWHSDFTER